MKAQSTILGMLATAIVVLALPAVAGAESFIPPGNSAVNQYTESIPSAGGNSETKSGKSRSAEHVLGERKARHLQEQGPEGQAAARIAAETAPATAPQFTSPEGTAGGSSTGSENGGGKSAQNGGGEGNQSGQGTMAATPGGHAKSASDANGSSGLREVVGQATGSSDSGEMGLLLPLVIAGAVISSLVFLLRRQRRAESSVP